MMSTMKKIYILYCLLVLMLVSPQIKVSAQVDTQAEIDSLSNILGKALYSVRYSNEDY